MPGLSIEYQEILRRELLTQYVAHLPPLLPNGYTPQQQADKQVNRALSAFALQSIFDLPAPAAAKAVVDDYNDNGLDAIYYDSTKQVLHLLQSKMDAGSEFKQGEAQAFCAGVRLLLQQDFSAFNINVQSRQVEIEKALAEAAHIQLWVVFAGPMVSGHALNTIEQLVADESHGEVERLLPDLQQFGPEKIAAELLARRSYPNVHAEVFLAHDSKVEEPQVTWFGMASLTDLVALHNQYGKALYERNVRYFLGTTKSDVNKGIQQTLVNEPKAFFYLNNGVTALCTEVKARERKAGRRRLAVRGLSIINGAQTVASAAEVANLPTKPNIADARVMLTLIQANADGTFGPRVTRARNSQNAVLSANFAAQDPTQERLRQELAGLGVAYHVRPEAGAVPDHNNILLDEAVAALSWLTNDPRYPVWQKSGKGDLSNPDSPAYKSLFRADLPGAHLANAVFFSREITKLLKKADLSSGGIERLVYRHGVQAIGWVYMKRLRNRIEVPKPVDPNDVPTIISVSFDAMRQAALDGFPKFTGPLAFFKSQGDTTPFVAALMESSYQLTGHPALPPLKQKGGQAGVDKLIAFMAGQAPQA
jgi:hypothetical protein